MKIRGCGLKDEQAHKKLKQMVEETSGYRNSRRERNKRHEEFNEALNEMREKCPSKPLTK